MFSESPPLVRRVIRLLLLPYLYVKLLAWPECKRTPWALLSDLLYIFFVLRDYPEHYGPCRLWERPRAEWSLYYGSNYNPYQRARLRRDVHPLQFEALLNNKEVCDVLCRGLGLPVPEVFGTVDPYDDAGAKLTSLFDECGNDQLIIKPILGHAGIGIALAEATPDGIRIRTRQGLVDLVDFVPSERCVVQEVVIQHPDLTRVAEGSVNTVRMMTMLTKSGDVLVIGSSMRFGVGRSYVDNWSAGGIAVGVDVIHGRLQTTGYDKHGHRYERHPVSEVEFAGFPVPRWEEAVELGALVQRSLPFTKILGLDLAITAHGAVLIEINGDADFVFQEQTSGPLLERYSTWRAFRDYDLFYNPGQWALHSESEANAR